MDVATNFQRIGLKKQLFFVMSFLIIFSFSSASWSCTRIIDVDNNFNVIVGRTMDWFEEMSTNLVVNPRGIERNGGDPVNPLKWTSKYGSITALYNDFAATDGMNEKGFAAHALWLSYTTYGDRNKSVPGLSLLMWVQFYLDNFQTVNEAIQYTRLNSFQLVPFLDPVTNLNIKIRLAIEDATGDSAIIECDHGSPITYHHPQDPVLINDHTDSIQFFTNTIEDEVSNLMSVLENIGNSHEYFPGTPKTLWRTCSDLTHHVYYFNSAKNITMNYTQLDRFKLDPSSPIMKLDLVNNPRLMGDVTSKYVPAK